MGQKWVKAGDFLTLKMALYREPKIECMSLSIYNWLDKTAKGNWHCMHLQMRIQSL